MKRLLAILAAAAVIGILAWKLCFPAHRPTAAPALLAQWEEAVYSLDEDEEIRFIPPPFSPQRPTRHSYPASLKKQGLTWQQLMLRVSNGRILFSSASSGKGSVYSAFSWCCYFWRPPDLELPHELGRLPAEGDWIVRQEATLERRMKALESILSEITGRKLAIENPLVERDVVIVRGKWDFQVSNQKAAQFYISKDNIKLDGMGTLADSFKSLGEVFGRKLIDETEDPHPNEVFWTDRIFSIPLDDVGREKTLASLEKQTSLKFVQSRRVVPVWIVSEKGQGR